MTPEAGRFARRWIARVALGEAAGFAVAAATGVALTVSATPVPLAYPAAVVAGAVEGAALGLGQVWALGASRPPAARWVAATSTGAALAWALGMLPSTIGLDGPSALTWAVVAVGGVVLLAAIPVAQWLVLRLSGRRDARAWVPVTMAAWAVAVAWTAAPSPLIDETTPVAVLVAAYLAAGVLMALTIAGLTAPLAWRLFGRLPRIRSGR